MGETDPDFVWQDYLEDTKTEEVNATAFTHVEHSLDSGLKIGMKLEVPNPGDCSTYWLASVRMICGDLLLLRTVGFSDSSGDNWFTVKESEFHPIGWCLSNKKKLYPPKDVLEKHPDVNSLLSRELKNSITIPTYLYDDLKSGVIPIDKIKCGMKLEVTESCNPKRVWMVTIMENVGGRLLLKYDGIEKSLNQDMWLFYLDDRLHLAGYAGENGVQYCPPEEIKAQHTEEEWKDILKQSLKEAKENPFPSLIFEPKIPLKKHKFEKGMKLEAVNTLNLADLCPATVTEIFDDFHFLITIDTYQEDKPKCVLCCNSNNPYIFPIKWAERNGLDLKIPKGYEIKCQAKFSWDDYLRFCRAKAAAPEFFSMHFSNEDFQIGKKLEAADPFSLGIIKAATIVKVVDPLIWLHFDNEECEQKNVISSIKSFNIFPVGWCASNSYPLQTPLVYKPEEKVEAVINKVEDHSLKPSQDTSTSSSTGQQSKSWCPKIYFNHRCFTGPLLSKSKLAELPQAIGPGPLRLVISDVISRVVSIAYKSSRVLQILQFNGKSTIGMVLHEIKAKYKGKTNIASIKGIHNSEEVEEFCKNTCLKLECCPHLFGPKHVGETCPSNCHTQTKTKFGYNFVKKKKVGRPPLSSTIMTSSDNREVFKRGPGRKKKRQHWKHLLSVKLEELSREEKAISRDSSETDDISKCESRVKPSNDEPPRVFDSRVKASDDEPSRVFDSKVKPSEDQPSKVFDSKVKPSEDQPSIMFDSRVKPSDDEPSRVPLIGKKKLKHTPSSSIVTRGAKLPNFGLWHHMSPFHSRRGRPRTKPIRPPLFPPRKVGRPVGSTKKALMAARMKEKEEEIIDICRTPSPIPEEDENMSSPELPNLPKPTLLESNPLEWSVEDVVQYLQKTDCAPLAPVLKEQEIDGQALLMLNLFSVKEYLHIKPEPAEKFCFLIKNLKFAYFNHFVK